MGLVFYLICSSCSLNMHGHEPSVARCLIRHAPLSTPILYVFVGGGGGDCDGSGETACMRSYIKALASY